MTARARARRQLRIARVERWFKLAREFERLTHPWPTQGAAKTRLDRFQKKYPDGGVINAAFLYDLFQLAIDREATP
jgi:hypothetical protein